MTVEAMLSPRQEATPLVSDLELESAILKGVASHRPVGQHKHILVIALQAQVHEQTGIWVPIDTLWGHLGGLYDLDALDSMSSSAPSLPDSPVALSPLQRPKRRRPRRGSASSGSSLSSPSPSPPPGPSRSARVIDSGHFARSFELPLGRAPDAGGSGSSSTRERRKSTPGPGPGAVRRDTDSAATSDDDEPDDWSALVYPRAIGGDEDEAAWEAGVAAQMERTEKKAGGSRRASGQGQDSGDEKRRRKGKKGKRGRGDSESEDERPAGRQRR
ncbi:MRG/MORF4L-binding protein [Vanrija pseudolonga]|uniref:MRG/MORF4L-binding protein n=1 Tax=Vanrija pseudolonga TaxID=143232 RepID=A0AAF1BRF6_9TREE|nr:MRG/MORF4L-binding protein [Vanrija pseudolonga]